MPPTTLAPTGTQASQDTDALLTPAALSFLAELHTAFAHRRTPLLEERRTRSALLTRGAPLDFLPATQAVRQDRTWHIAPPAPGLADRRTELTTPPTRAAAKAALTSGAQLWTADFEDATSPSWPNILTGHLTLLDLVEGRLTAPEGHTAPTVAVRPRGWHLTERHLLVDGDPLPAPLADFGLYAFHRARRRTAPADGPYFSLPKLENHREARLWNEIFTFAERTLGLAHGTIRATVLIETVTAAFEMDEILYELRDHAAGLTAARWDYLFSLVKTVGHRPGTVLTDRSRAVMTAPYLRAWTDLLVRTAHRRGAHAIGGLTAQVLTGDPAADEAVCAAVRRDKEREAEEGFDGSWVAHPSLVPLARAAWDTTLGARPHQLERTRDDVHVTPADLLRTGRDHGRPGTETVRATLALCLRYYDAWLRGDGAPVLDGVVEDTSGAEICRAQIWQWLRHGAVDRPTVLSLLDSETAALAAADPAARHQEARDIFVRGALGPELPEFFTTEASTRHLTGPVARHWTYGPPRVGRRNVRG
ncbi:malate synthase A [Streptomyces sp. AJ-1]|uniref:malate synthase n=1 Tax=Streptomyces sp. AJ-1 TaxID=3044384 RepID=UPI00249CB18B|nr:malate synthase A [Streptomyces sp. AJ-1]MDI3346479.1 malate synthase A [Streptomyces sp. AJ-1]